MTQNGSGRRPLSRTLADLSARGRDVVTQAPPKATELYRKNKRFRRFVIITVEVFIGLVVLGGIVAGLLYQRLSQGPVSVGFIVPSLERAINRDLTGLRIKIGSAVIKKAEDGPAIRFRLRDIRLLDSEDALVMKAPEAAIGLNANAFFFGRITPASIDFIRPTVILAYSPQTGVAFSFASAAKPAPPSPDAPQKGAPAPFTASPETKALTPSLRPTIDSLGPLPDKAETVTFSQSLARIFRAIREKGSISAYLTRFSVRNARLILKGQSQAKVWRIPEFTIHLSQGENTNLITGVAQLVSATGPWQMDFRIRQSPDADLLSHEIRIRDLVPSDLVDKLPALPWLKAFRLPISANIAVATDPDGNVRSTEADIRLAAGHLGVPWSRTPPMLLDEGRVRLRYRAQDGRIELLPSALAWGQSSAVMTGEFRPFPADDGTTDWEFYLRANNVALATEEFGLPPMPLERWTAYGVFDPDKGRIGLSSLLLQTGDASVTFSGEIVDAPESPAIRLTGHLSPMPLAFLKAVWPRLLTPDSRSWIGKNVVGGRILGGRIDVAMAGGVLARLEKGGDIAKDALKLSLTAEDLFVRPHPAMPAIYFPGARVAIAGRELQVTATKTAVMELPSGRRIAFSQVKFAIDDIRPIVPEGRLSLALEGSVGAMLEFLEHPPLTFRRPASIVHLGLDGRVSGKVTLQMPLHEDLKPSQMRVTGNLRVKGLKTKRVFGDLNLDKGEMDLAISEDAVTAQGHIELNGVPARIIWQKFLSEKSLTFPALRIHLTLDATARKRLGIDLNEFLKGSVPMEIAIGNEKSPTPAITVRADLRNVEIALRGMGWRKPPGQQAVLEFQLQQAPDGGLLLSPLRLSDEKGDLAIRGSIRLDKEKRLIALSLPELSLDFLTHMSLKGERRKRDGVLTVSVTGSSYNGKQLFRSLFSQRKARKKGRNQPHPPDMDLSVQLKTVIGFGDTTVTDVVLNAKRRKGKIVALDARGKLNGKAPIAVEIRTHANGKRILRAHSEDAGDASRLLGFYQNMEGGEAKLEVDLSGRGVREKVGTLWVRDFAIVGDQVVDEVLANMPESGNGGRKKRQVIQTRLAFQQLRASFAMGNGQFLLRESYVNGPILGATLRGRVDFTRQRINLVGTYVPLYGLNSALGAVPLLGDILVGRSGEGVFGITFTIQGPLRRPVALVNPISLVTPGVFRQIWEAPPPSAKARTTSRAKERARRRAIRQRLLREKRRRQQELSPLSPN